MRYVTHMLVIVLVVMVVGSLITALHGWALIAACAWAYMGYYTYTTIARAYRGTRAKLATLLITKN